MHYGATQFTKDLDLWVEASEGNLARLTAALAELDAEQRLLPGLEGDYLERGHAVHFELHTDAGRYRLDLMTNPPRVDSFEEADGDAVESEVLGVRCRVVDLARLVELKKTQRDEDYPVIRNLVTTVFRYLDERPEERPRLGPWVCRESRSPHELLRVAAEWEDGAQMLRATARDAAITAADCTGRDEGDATPRVEDALRREQHALQQTDRDYWQPLVAELRELHRSRTRDSL